MPGGLSLSLSVSVFESCPTFAARTGTSARASARSVTPSAAATRRAFRPRSSFAIDFGARFKAIARPLPSAATTEAGRFEYARGTHTVSRSLRVLLPLVYENVRLTSDDLQRLALFGLAFFALCPPGIGLATALAETTANTVKARTRTSVRTAFRETNKRRSNPLVPTRKPSVGRFSYSQSAKSAR